MLDILLNLAIMMVCDAIHFVAPSEALPPSLTPPRKIAFLSCVGVEWPHSHKSTLPHHPTPRGHCISISLSIHITRIRRLSIRKYWMPSIDPMLFPFKQRSLREGSLTRDGSLRMEHRKSPSLERTTTEMKELPIPLLDGVKL